VRACTGKRISCDLAQAGRLERAASGSLGEDARVGSRADGKNVEKWGVCTPFGTCFGALLRLDEHRDHVFRHAGSLSHRLSPLQAT